MALQTQKNGVIDRKYSAIVCTVKYEIFVCIKTLLISQLASIQENFMQNKNSIYIKTFLNCLISCLENVMFF